MSAAMDRRGDATKAFYAALTPEQQKVFDAQHQKHWQHGGKGMHHGEHGADKPGR
jgi:protein CpxP